jgi:hypothetical protein
MIFDRIVEDVLGFIRRLLWWRSTESKTVGKPFQSMRTIQGEYGVLSLVEGRDTPRAVRSWIYSPRRWELNSTKTLVREVQDDLHIYLDFLGPLPGVNTPQAQQERQERQRQRRSGGKIPTHRLQIVQASHFLNSEGFYDCAMIYWTDFDFYWPMGQSPETYARIAVDMLAHHCLNQTNPYTLKAEDWAAVLQAIWQKITAQPSFQFEVDLPG